MKFARYLFVAIIALAPLSAFSQDSPPAIKWTAAGSVEDGFSVEAPDTFKYVREKALGRFNEGRGEYLSDGLYLYVFVDRPKNARQNEYVQNFVMGNRQVGSVEDFGGQQATKYQFLGPDQYFHTVLISRSETRLYSFHAVSRTAEDPSVSRFIKSIRFGQVEVGPLPADLESPPASPASDLKMDLETVSPGPAAAAGPNRGSASTGPANNISGTGSGTAPGTTRTVSAPLKILSKMKAKYTDYARFYNISGTVLLRVTFMADNSIGEIKTIRSLPFGLTEEAITAARQMKFEAEIVDGQPRNTSRPVSFQFNIY